MREKRQRPAAKWVGFTNILLLTAVVLLVARHMFSDFLPLVYINDMAAEEYGRMLDIINGRISPDILFYGPGALIVKIFSFFFKETEWYKGFIISNILLSLIVIWTFYIVLSKLFQKKLNKIVCLLITIAFYFGMPAYCFLYGGYMKSSIWTILFCLLILGIWKLFRKKIRMKVELVPAFGKALMIFGVGLAVWLVSIDFLDDFAYFIPIIAIVLIESLWNQKINKFLTIIYLVVTIIEIVLMYITKESGMDSGIKVTMLCIYWSLCWLLTAQAVQIVRKRRYGLELSVYGMFVLVLLALQAAGVNETLYRLHRVLVEDVQDNGTYLTIYGNSIELMQKNYAEDEEVFFATDEFMELAERVLEYPKEDVLVITDEITESEKAWFDAITDRKSISVDGMSITDEELAEILQKYDADYVVLFTNSRVYMARYPYVSGFPRTAENMKGVILQKPAAGW